MLLYGEISAEKDDLIKYPSKRILLETCGMAVSVEMATKSYLRATET